MKRSAEQRPAHLTFIGYSNLAAGLLGLFCGLLGLWRYYPRFFELQNAAGRLSPVLDTALDRLRRLRLPVWMGRQYDWISEHSRHMPGHFFVELTTALLILTLGILAILAGVRLLRMKKGGARLSIIYALLTILVRCGYVAYQFIVVVPVLTTAMDFPYSGPQSPADALGDRLAKIVWEALFIVHALVLLILMSRIGPAALSPRQGALKDAGETAV